jgi:hypothetical protein
MEKDNLIKSLDAWGELVVSDMVSYLEQIKKNNTGNLAKSLRVKARKDGEQIFLEFFGNDYSEFVRLGVQGKDSSSKAPNSPFKFGTGTGKKGGLTAGIDRWVVTKGIGGIRDEKGRFIPRKNLVRLIARKIYRFGIKPTNFIFPFFQKRDQLDEVIEKEFINQIILDIRKSFKNGN